MNALFETCLTDTLATQKAACVQHPIPTYAERLRDLSRLAEFLRKYQQAICDAVDLDFGHRSSHETVVSEILPVLNEIKHVRHRLRTWMKPQRRSVDWKSFFGAKNRVVAQPLGVVGVIVPWNFPVFLSLGPLVNIMASGNRAMIKMSENSRHLTRLLQNILPAYFSNDKVCFIEGEEGVGPFFSRLPFDYLLFTGSAQTGRLVMEAAAQNLCPVTLELGGKSPAVVLEDFDTRLAAERILYAKCLNAGQICVTVDHVYVPEHQVQAFVAAAQSVVLKRYAVLDAVDYTSIIDQRAFERLVRALEQAKSLGAQLIQLLPGPAYDVASRKISPHLVLNAPADCELMTREIFGPILPVIAYSDLTVVVRDVQSRSRPLAFYPFSNQKSKIDYLLTHVMSGGVCVNEVLMHVVQTDMPFGGVGGSGMGHYHGYEGFHTFSKLRPVFYQARWSAASLLAPPYGKMFDRITQFLMR